MRVSTQQMWNSSLATIGTASVDQSTARDLISTGRRIRSFSDDPAAAERSSTLRADSSAIEQYERAGGNAIALMNAQDRTLQTVLDRMGRVEELTIALASDTLKAEARDAAAAEVAGIRAELVSIMNETHGGRSLFGGFQDNALTDGPGGVTFSGDTGAILRRIGDDQIIQVNIDARETLGFAAGRSLFDVLDDIVADGQAADVAALGGIRLDELVVLRKSVSAGLGVVGTRTNRVESTMEDLASEQVTLRRTMSDLEDADVVEASIKVSEANLAYEAALAASAQVNRVSLLNYL